MPLVPCPDCHRQVSDAAPACIHCGRPRPGAPLPRPAEAPLPGRRRHPLAADPSGDTLSLRAVLRFAVAAGVIALVVASWMRGGGPEGESDLLSGLISLGLGVSLLLMPVPQESARTPGARRRGDWGEWFSRQEERQEFRWNRVAGWVLVAVGVVYLLLALP